MTTFRRGHPRTQFRWRIAQWTWLQLLAALLILEAALAGLVSLLYLASGHAVGYLAALRAVLGIDGLPYARHNTYQQILGIFAGLVALVAPAVVIGIAALRLFTVRPIHWRALINACLVNDIRSDFPRLRRPDLDAATDDGTDAVLQVRFYRKYAPNFAIHDISATAHLRWPAGSKRDDTVTYKSLELDILKPDGSVTKQRTWPQMGSSMPFTVYIPAYAPLVNGRVHQIQGVPLENLIEGAHPAILVTIRARIVNLNLDFSDEHRYDLTTSLQLGRAASLDPKPGYLSNPKIQKSWDGWDRFDEAETYGVFVYGSLVDIPELQALLGVELVEGRDYIPAYLRGYERSWSVGTDNDGPQQTHYRDPATGTIPSVFVTFVNIDENAGATTGGILLRTDMLGIQRLDRREANYDRMLVHKRIVSYDSESMTEPDVIFTYIGKPDRVQRTRAAIEDGRARINRAYLDRVRSAFESHGHLAEDLEIDGRIPVVALDRIRIRATSAPAPRAG
ncbi:MAG TPA: gamma-glutamylcyclotransferase family protein [Micromonosporaceae bacterium]